MGMEWEGVGEGIGGMLLTCMPECMSQRLSFIIL